MCVKRRCVSHSRFRPHVREAAAGAADGEHRRRGREEVFHRLRPAGAAHLRHEGRVLPVRQSHRRVHVARQELRLRQIRERRQRERGH